MVSVAILGASGYVGGELLRLLLGHPEVSRLQATSESRAGKPVGATHPHLRHHTDLNFIGREALERCDVLFMAMPHGVAASDVSAWHGKATVTIDLSSDFRLKCPELYETYYRRPHPASHLPASFTPGIPELYRPSLARADRIAGPGCTALAAILVLFPLRQAGVIEPRVFVDSKVGSSGAGARLSRSTHHSLRAGGVRIFKSTGHRHEAEIITHCGMDAYVTVCSVDMVRGILLTAYCTLSRPATDVDLRSIYRAAYAGEPFTRLVKRESEGTYSLPEPKILSGTNYCDVAFQLTRDGKALVALSALDNLTKGAAGNAVHCMNIRFAFEETSGFTPIGTHPA